MSLRLIPNLYTLRPCDTIETAECWALAIKATETPSVLALTRQGLPQLRGQGDEAWTGADNLCAKGGYRLRSAKAARKVVLVASGSEVALAADCAAQLEEQGIGVDVVSMPCTELFDTQPQAYKADVLPSDALIVSIEAGVTQGWERYTGIDGLNIGIDRFGASAPAGQLFEKFGLVPEAIVPQILKKLSN